MLISPEGKKSPKVKKVGSRRVRTEPSEGQHEEPALESDSQDSLENDDRLRADKPPHY
jgi:hypothetical protein